VNTHTSWVELRRARLQEPEAREAYDATRQAFGADAPSTAPYGHEGGGAVAEPGDDSWLEE
jgi:hypothetical protein